MGDVVTRVPPRQRTGPPSAPRVLVVEDHEPLCRLVVRVLDAEGYDVQGVGTAAAALRVSTREHLDLLIADHDVPGAHGTEIARRSVAHNPALRVLFVSGSAPHSLDLEVHAASVAFLQKPFSIDDLVAVVPQVLACPRA